MAINQVSDEFPLDEQLIYLNHAGVSPWPARSIEAVRRFADENLRLGASRYPDWLETERQLRLRLAQMLNAPSLEDIALLKNTSEALSVVAYGLDWRERDNVVITNQEFPSNRIVWESLSRYGVTTRLADLSASPTPEDALFRVCDGNTRLIAVSAVQYATGLKMDLERIGAYCRSNGILFCIDAIQQLGALPLDVQACHGDFVMADGHKWMLGPEGVAVFYCRAELRSKLALHQYGWHMVEDHGNFERLDWVPARSARRFEAGSPNLLGIHALNASLSLLLDYGMLNISKLILNNTLYMIDIIKNSDVVKLISQDEPERTSGIVTFRHRHAGQEELYRHLTQNGVICALRAGGIRFSPHFYTPREKIDRTMKLVLDYR